MVSIDTTVKCQRLNVQKIHPYSLALNMTGGKAPGLENDGRGKGDQTNGYNLNTSHLRTGAWLLYRRMTLNRSMPRTRPAAAPTSARSMRSLKYRFALAGPLDAYRQPRSRRSSRTPALTLSRYCTASSDSTHWSVKCPGCAPPRSGCLRLPPGPCAGVPV